ncbi:UBA1 enzyme, partial [Trogon melanurus]|nr:UBA1 enzyme [Trogon melanurus]
QFFLRKSGIVQNRAKASQQALAELNPLLVMAVHTRELLGAFLDSFQVSPHPHVLGPPRAAAPTDDPVQVVVLTEYPLEEQLRVRELCHAQGICFIVANTKGLAGSSTGTTPSALSRQLFCDFGERFVIDDLAEGDLVCSNPDAVTCMGAEDRHSCIFCDSDLVTFSDMEGITELNGQEPIPCMCWVSPQGVLAAPAQALALCWQEPLYQALAEPRICVVSPKQLQHSCRLHAAFQALHAFCGEQHHLLGPGQNLRGALDEDVMRAFTSVSTGDLCPVAAVIGAVAAQ